MKKYLDSSTLTALFLSFVLVFIKKWEVGSNLDPLWYSAVAKNIALTGNFFNFSVSQYEASQIYDHMPLTYWVVGALMKTFGISDFVARFYTLLCGFFTLFLIFLIGKKIKNSFFGLLALTFSLFNINFIKWNGQLLHDIPLTLYLLAATYFFICFYKDKKNHHLYLVSFFFVLALWSKGPVALAFPFALTLWLVFKLDFSLFKNKHFYIALLFMGLLLSLFFLPALSFHGENYYSLFYRAKKSYLGIGSEQNSHFFDYFKMLAKLATIQILLAFITFGIILKPQNKKDMKEEHSYLWLLAFLIFSIIIPFSFFKIKMGHYIFPLYPYLTLFSAYPLCHWLANRINLQKWLFYLCLGSVCFFVAFPVKIGGGREKHFINIVNILKFDSHIKEKNIYFLGGYEDAMDLVQTFSFYGSLNIRYSSAEFWSTQHLGKNYLLVKAENLPLKTQDKNFSLSDCFILSGIFCVLTDSTSLKLTLPKNKLPQEIY
ncbi:MAG: glycosyltransferase family 39 protein [Bacteriovoracaceae bacterium]|nr:glycosyltransferase family 39 protein [Bacteriovoracaceae bacterium]